jgi:fructose-1,6-bisphosphatase/inositol monophosphatase family enzyme/GNAT superfamily N-acetyltransferase
VNGLRARPACPDDRDAVLRLVREMGGHEDVERLGTSFGLVLVRPSVRAYVAEEPQRAGIVGYAELHARPVAGRDRIEGWLATLAVTPDRRGTGVGRMLVAAAEAGARELGCDEVVLESSAWRERSHAFYRELGFAERPAALRFTRAVSACASDDLAERFLAAAARAATAVGGAIVGLEGAASRAQGADGAPTEAADAAAEEAALAELLPLGIAIVSEEAGLVGATRAPGPGEAWISLDPLDGTRNFRAGYGPYATSIGLVRDGVAIAGLVCDLVADRRWSGGRGLGAWRDGVPIRARDAARARSGLVAAPSPAPGSPELRVPDGLTRLRISGSSALDLVRIADGALGAFLSTDRPVTHVHDIAAALAIVEEAGGVASDLRGEPLRLLPDPEAAIAFVAAGDRATLESLLRTPYGVK